MHTQTLTPTHTYIRTCTHSDMDETVRRYQIWIVYLRHTHTHTHTYKQTHTNTHMHTRTHTHTHTYAYTHTHTHTHTYTHTHTNTHMHTRTHTYIHTHIIHTCTHSDMHVTCVDMQIWSVCVYPGEFKERLSLTLFYNRHKYIRRFVRFSLAEDAQDEVPL